MPKIMPKAQLGDHIFLAQFNPPPIPLVLPPSYPPNPPSPPPYFYHQQGNIC